MVCSALQTLQQDCLINKVVQLSHSINQLVAENVLISFSEIKRRTLCSIVTKLRHNHLVCKCDIKISGNVWGPNSTKQ